MHLLLPRRTRLVVGGLSLALALSACGGGDDSADEVAATASAAVDAAVDAAASAGADAKDLCALKTAAAFGQNLGAAFAGAGAGSGSGAPDAQEVKDGFDRAVKAAPAEIRDDFAVLRDALVPYLTFLTSGKDAATLAQDPQFAALAQKFSAPEVAAASKAIESYFASAC